MWFRHQGIAIFRIAWGGGVVKVMLELRKNNWPHPGCGQKP